jgi:hypothetical protein
MLSVTRSHTTGPRRRTWRWGVIASRWSVGLVLAALIVAGCMPQGPVAQVNLVIEVFNQTNETGSLKWQGPGHSETEPIQPCRLANTDYGVGPGTWQVTIEAGPNKLTESLMAASTGSAWEVFAIRPGGEIEHLYRLTDQQTGPPAPSGC